MSDISYLVVLELILFQNNLIENFVSYHKMSTICWV